MVAPVASQRMTASIIGEVADEDFLGAFGDVAGVDEVDVPEYAVQHEGQG